MRKFFKIILLLSLFQLWKATSYAQEPLPFEISVATYPDPILGYGVPMDIGIYWTNYGSSDYVLPANFIEISVALPAGMIIDPTGSMPDGFELIIDPEGTGEFNSALFRNTEEIVVVGDGFYEFIVTTTPEEAYIDESFIVQIDESKDPEFIFFDYFIDDVEDETFRETQFTVPDVEIDPLSVQFVSVYANADENCTVNVNWTVASTDAASYAGIRYAVERMGHRGYEQIAEIIPQADQYVMNYVDDKASKGINIYRIAQITRDGRVAYSHDVRANVSCDAAQNIKIYPNPAIDFVSVSGVKAGQKVSIFSINGVEIYSLDVQQDNQVIQINDLPAGAYNVAVSENGNAVFSGNLIKK